MIPTKFNPLNLAEKLTGRPMASGTRHFFKDSILYSAANFVPKLMSLIMMPIVTRRLTPGEYNTFGVYVSGITAICIIMSFQAELSIARYAYEDKKHDFPEFISTQLIFTGLLSAVMLVQFWIFRSSWSWVFALPIPIFLCAVVTSAFQILHQVYFQLMLARKESQRFFNYNLAKQVIYVVVGIALLFILAHNRTMGLVYAHLIATVPIGIIFLVYMIRLARPAFRWEHLKYALHLTIPGVPGALSLFALNFFDRIYFQHHNPNLGGAYTFAYQVGMLIMMLTSGIFAAYMPRFYENRNKEQTAANQLLFSRNLKLLLLAAVGLILMGKPMAHILGRAAYFGALPIIPIIITGYIFMYLGQCYGLYIAYRRKFIFLQSLSMILAGVANVGLIYWLLPLCQDDALKVKVAALSTLIPYLVQWLCVYFISRTLLKEKTIDFKGTALYFALYLAFATGWVLWIK